MALQPGQSIGPYRIQQQVGMGGMATVYKAYHPAMDRTVALKVLPESLASDPTFQGRFQQEVRLIASLEHPNILPVYDAGEDQGIHYLVMRYLEAGTLKDRLERGPLPAAELARLTGQLASALQYAHERGIVHRDIKPSNVLVDAAGNAFLTDFGVAKLVQGSSRFTATDALIGTPAYMSPEQAQGLPADARSDQYSLGVVVYEMLTGRVPFEAETPVAVVLMHISEPLTPPRTFNPEISERLESTLLRALAKDPPARFHDLIEFNAAVQAALQRTQAPTLAGTTALPASARAATLPGAPPSPPQTRATPAAGRKLPARGMIRAIGGLILLGMLVLGGLLLARRGGPASPARTGSPTAAPAGAAVGERPAQPAAVPPQEGARGWSTVVSNAAVGQVLPVGDEIWAATTGGVIVWKPADGSYRRITTADGLPSNSVTALLVDGPDDVWVSTALGVVHLTGGRAVLYNTADGLDSEAAGPLLRTPEGLLVGTSYGQGLNLLGATDNRWSLPDFPSGFDIAGDPALLENKVNSLALAPDGALWVGTVDGLGRRDASGWQIFHARDGLPADMVTHVYFDREGAPWVTTAAGAARLTASGWESIPQLAERGINAMLQSADGDYWFSFGGGLARFDPAHGDWQEYGPESIGAYDATGLAQDAAGTLWVGTYGAGLASFDGQNWRRWLPENDPGLASFAYLFGAPDGALWAASGDGALARMDPVSGAWLPRSGLPGGAVPRASDSAGNLWLSTWEGLARLTPQGAVTLYTTEQGLPEGEIYAVAVDGAGGVWVGTRLGLAHMPDPAAPTFTVYTAAGGSLPSDEVLALLVDRSGALWIGAVGGAARRQGDQFTLFLPGNPLDPGLWSVDALAEDLLGNVWLGMTGGGLARFAPAAGQWTLFAPGQPGLGLQDGDVISLAVAPDGALWVGTYSGGAVRYDGAAWQSFTTRDGLAGDRVDAIYAAPDGAVWLATDGGLNRFGP